MKRLLTYDGDIFLEHKKNTWKVVPRSERLDITYTDDANGRWNLKQLPDLTFYEYTLFILRSSQWFKPALW